MIFKKVKLFLSYPYLENQERKIYFPKKQYRIWNYTSPKSFHARNVVTEGGYAKMISKPSTMHPEICLIPI